jgi:EAL domain-containing protein (putative c-di-GMP-specific phosphodiesterase class I)
MPQTSHSRSSFPHWHYPHAVNGGRISHAFVAKTARIQAFLQRAYHADRGIVLLLCLQAAAAVAIATLYRPHIPGVHIPTQRSLSLMTAGCGAAISLVPTLLALLRPGSRATRIAIGIAQLLMTTLLISLTGSMERHWHAARSFMLFVVYADWLVLVSAAVLYVMTSGETTELSRNTTTREHVLAAKLRKALNTTGLSLVYQPIFRDDQHMVAVEALTRWRDPQEGTISPTEFIPMAEATGLIVPLSDWILREACEQMVLWTSIEPRLERLAVNVSVKHIWRADFVATIKRILTETGLPPNQLELEVTESALVTDFDTVKRHLTTLRHLGVRISIDDFGTGYSSLNRVRELDADTLKVDRLFVQGASETPSGIAVVQAIIDMAHSLKLSVVAEGVETPEQLQMLRTMHCDEMQGFFLARPQAAEMITATLHNSADPSSPRTQCNNFYRDRVA